MLASRVASAALTRSLHAKRAQVSIRAFPFWELFAGRFGSLHVVAYDAVSGRLSIARVSATWQRGAIDLRPLSQGKAFRAWAGGGPIHVTLWLKPAALMAQLPHGGPLKITSIRLKAPDAEVRGRITVGELRLPFMAVGVPAVAEEGRLVLFRVIQVHAGPIALRSALGIPVVDLTHSPLYPTLHVESASVGRSGIIVRLFGQGLSSLSSNGVGKGS